MSDAATWWMRTERETWSAMLTVFRRYRSLGEVIMISRKDYLRIAIDIAIALDDGELVEWRITNPDGSKATPPRPDEYWA